MLIFLLIISPLIALFISLIFRKSQTVTELLSVVSSLTQLLVSFGIASIVVQDGFYAVSSFLVIDSLGCLLILITSVIGLAATSYNIGYIREEIAKEIIDFKKAQQSYMLINLFLFAMFLAIAVNNPVATWISIEATTLSTIFLISFYNKPTAIEAAWKYLVINSVGLLLAFLGTIIYLASATPLLHGSFITWDTITTVAGSLNPALSKIAFIFILIGYGTKLGIAPMHTWRPDAYSKAPIPVVALLSGALLNIALLPILRFKFITDITVGSMFTQNLFIFLGVLSIAIAAFAIVKQGNYKRLLAYSSVEHAGLILLGFGFGGIGMYASLLHMLYHALAKSSMFLLSGNIFLKYSSPKIKNVTSVLSVLPTTGVLFVIGFLALTGVPPFGLFITKFYIILSGMQHYAFLTIGIVFLLAVIFFGFFQQINSMLFGEKPNDIKVGEYSMWTIIPTVVLLSLLVFLSVYLPDFLQTLLQNTLVLFKKG